MSLYVHSYCTYIIFCAMIWKLRLLILIFSLVVAKPADMLLGVCEGIPRDEQKADGQP